MEIRHIIHENLADETQFYQRLEISIANKLGLTDLRNGGHVIRNEKGWRDNEKWIDYSWVVTASRSFIGWGGLIFVKFDSSNFREIENKEELIKGIFLYNSNGITEYYFEHEVNDFTDPIASMPGFNLFDAGKGMTLDGVGYRFHIMSANIDSVIEINNPYSPDWNNWKEKIWMIGKQLSSASKNVEMIKLFN